MQGFVLQTSPFRVLVLFHKIAYKLTPITMPDYLLPFDGNTRLRRTHLDSLSYTSSLVLRSSGMNNLNKSFFFRCHSLWNCIPFNIRNFSKPAEFKNNLIKHYRSQIFTEISEAVEPDLSSLETD